MQGTKLSVHDSLKSPEEIDDMKSIPYAGSTGSLMYAMVCTRPDISQPMGVSRRFISSPRRPHWDIVKRVFRYLKGTSDFALCYHGNLNDSKRTLNICGYADFDWVGDIDSRRSTSGYVFVLNGGAISWMSK